MMPLLWKTRPFWLWLLTGAGILALLMTSFLVRAWGQLNTPLSLNSTETFEVSAGASVARVAGELADNGWLDYPLLFTLWSRITDSDGLLQAGEYQLEPPITAIQLLSKLTSGEVKQYQLTLVEGWTFNQALDAIWASPGITATLTGQSGEAIAESLAFRFTHPEGQLFPDTYFYTRGTTDREVLQRAHQRLLVILDETWAQRAGALPFDSPYDALILASIVEKETAVPDERRQIASVFIRRLEQNMRLQSDPTVIYGMGARYDGNIDREALNEVTPYNTYRVNGLPPSPIALVGREAIQASVSPDTADALYFVSRGDGSHQFSANLEAHNAAVRRYQLGEEPQ